MLFKIIFAFPSVPRAVVLKIVALPIVFGMFTAFLPTFV